jgi:hypothetical protein
MTTVAIHQPQYLPYLGFFHKLCRCDIFVALDNVQFQKNGLQNRNKIKTRQGWQWLTVPVLQDFGQPIMEVVINRNVPWQRKHCNAIASNYGRAPFFNEFGPSLKLLLEQEWHRLNQLDMALAKWAMEALSIETPIVHASELSVEGNQTELLIAICQAVGADCYLSGTGGRRYMDLEAFAAAGITVEWQTFTSPVYPQLFPQVEFVPDLSAVDAIFNCGAKARSFLA